MRASAGAAALLFFLPALPAAPAEAPRARLEVGGTLKSQVDGVPVHTYEVNLETGGFVRIAADQQGVDLTLALVSPSGAPLAEVDSPTGEWDTEELLWVARNPGLYRVVVTLPEQAPAGASYTLIVREARAAAREDEARIHAQALFTEGYKLSQEERLDDQRSAVARLDEARALWAGAGEPYQEGLCLLVASASRHNYLNESARAVADYEAALAIFHGLKRRNLERESLMGMGLANYRLQRAPKALAAFEQALDLAAGPGASASRAQIHSNMGMVYDDVGERDRAADAYTRALRLLDETGGPAEVRQYTLNNLALVHDGLGEKQKALEEYRRSLALTREMKARKSEAIVLANIGRLYVDLGDPARGESFFRQSLEISRALGDRSSEALALMRMGRVQAEAGRPAEGARTYVEAASILDHLDDAYLRAVARNGLSDALLRSGDPAGARRAAEEAIALSPTDPSLRATGLTRLGNALVRLSENDAAHAQYREAAALREKLGDRLGLASTRLAIARLERARAQCGAALADTRASLDLLESLRTEVVSHDLRASFFAASHDAYAFTLDLLAEMHGTRPDGGFDRQALDVAERARARSLLDLLAESRVEIRAGAEPALLEREQALRRRLGAQLDAQARLLSGRHTDAQAEAMAAEIDGLRTQLQDVEEAIRARSPRYASLRQPVALSSGEVQQQLDSETTLLEFAFGEERAYLWTVTRASVRMSAVGPRSTLEHAALRFHEALTARNRRVRFESTDERATRVRRADGEAATLAAELGRTLLGPVAPGLTRRLLYVADGALQYVPLAALVPADGPPLVAEHEIVTLPSASVLAALRGEAVARRAPAKTIAVLADPVFDARDPRVRGGSSAAHASAPPADVQRSLEDAGENGISRLPNTRREARAILALVPPEQRRAALDFEASRATAMSPDLSKYRIVHFATHSLLNAAHPDLSGVVLSLVDREGRPQPGFLSTVDVFNLRLPADLVVLSGCRTALGKDVRGEGLVGLPRGFLYAGASRVISSLWKVDDAATADLMTALYREMLGAHHASPAAALASAQRALWRTKGHSPAYYWAGFTLQGEWR